MILNLRQHLFLSVAVPLSLGMLICVIAAIVPLYSSIHDWNNKTSDAIQQMNLAASTTRLAKLNENLQVIYDQLTHDLATLRNNTYMHLERTLPVANQTRTYYGRTEIDSLTPPTEDVFVNDGPYQTFSAVWQKGTSNYNTFIQTQPYVNESSLVEPLLKAMYKANKTPTAFYFKVMMGFETGLYRRYPYGIFPDDYLTSTDYCTGTLATYGPGYDPRCRPWYDQSAQIAKAATANEFSVVFSQPYIDASTKLTTISASSPLYDRTNGIVPASFIGVVNIDWNMKAIDDIVLLTLVSHTGYTFLMDKKGNLISHPLWDRTMTPLATAALIEPNFATLWNTITSAASLDAFITASPYVMKQFTVDVAGSGVPPAYLLMVASPVDGVSYYIGLTTTPTTGYILVMMLPASDLEQDNSDALASLRKLLGGGTAGLVIVLVFLFVVLLVGTHYIARYYSRAIKDAALILEQATKPNTAVQLSMRDPVCYEIDLLFKQFGPMFVAIRFGNASFYEGNLDQALIDYQTADELMRRMDNKKGLAKVHNNKGNVYLKMGQLENGMREYNEAIRMGQELLSECENERAAVNKKLLDIVGAGDGIEMKEDYREGGKSSKANGAKAGSTEASLLEEKKRLQTERISLLIQLAKRQANLAVLYKQQGKSKLAYEQMQRATDNHLAADDDLGLAKVSSNLAQFYIEDGKLNEAQELIQSTYTKLCTLEQGHAPDPLALQYATMTLGLLTQKQGKLEDAAGWLQYTLQLQDMYTNIIDTTVQQTCFAHLESVFRLLRNDVMAKHYSKLHHHDSASKNCMFALDCSGSMAGGSIVRCRDSIKEIIQNHIEPEDRVGLITFNNKSQIVFGLTQRGVADETLEMFMNSVETKTEPRGSTSLWDALCDGINEFSRVSAEAKRNDDKDEAKRNNWLIGLTDGEDNASNFTYTHVVRAIQKTPVHVILITVGSSYDSLGINAIIEAVKAKNLQGHHIKIGSDSIGSAFKSVAKLITAQLNVETI